MNQEQNNFNTQGNNGIPNNQPLNNQQPIKPQPIPSFKQTIMQETKPQPTNTFESGNASIQNFNNKPPKKMNLALILGIVAAVIIVGVGSFFIFNSNNKQLLNKENSQQEQNEISSNKDVLPNEIIKVVSLDNYDTYLLSASGKIYIGNLKESLDFTELSLETTEKVVDISDASEELLFKLQNGEYYLISNDITTDKEIKTSVHSTAKRIMLDNITQYAIEDVMCNSYLFLTKDGDLYKLIFDTNSETNVEKIMSNIVYIEDDLRNAAMIDKNNNAYVIGFNVKENGLLGTSETLFKDGVCTPTKVAENVKEIDIFGWNLMHALHIYYINQNNELYVMGHSANNMYFMGKDNNFLNTPVKIYDNVKHVHAMSNSVVIETLDGKLIEKDTALLYSPDKEITSNYRKITLPRGYGGMLILKNKTLYGYGSSYDLDKFGLQNKDKYNFNEIIKIKDNIKQVFLSTDFNGSTSFIITTDGKLFTSGYNTGGEFKEINY